MFTSSEVFLKNFHKENPGCTPSSFLCAKTRDNRNSYDLLSDYLKISDAGATILDLACGDGTLIKNILDRKIPDLKILGVDMSIGELELAREMFGLQQSTVKLIEAKAQALPVAKSSVDFLFCHMALMLMDDVETVISEVHRCLKPDRLFSAIVGGKSKLSPLFKEFLKLLDQALEDENKTWLSNLGDRRTHSEEGLKSLFDEVRFYDINVTDVKLEFHTKPNELIDFFMLMYDVGLLSKERQQQLKSELLSLLKSETTSEGIVEHFMWLRQITCRSRG